ncbi:MAG: molybdopterin molybdotransferase MoeA, partial [Planctomycetes bacterium]|nr:molybdopterin molybdotransferase MoeA [Planctomycetota bacterium]
TETEIISDVDSPPFDKALMDGYAVRAADIFGESTTLDVIEELTAGQVPSKVVGTGEATCIMTGAPIPDGADAVVKVEETQFDTDSQTVRITGASIKTGTNLILRGTSMKQGDIVLSAGRLLRPQELGSLAEMGEHIVSVRRRPKIAVLATGDELVPINATPGPGQIRNSNETMLAAQIRHAGGEAVPLGIAKDDATQLREKICVGLQSDVLLLSGGVSAGKLDLVPSALEAAGVKQVFHKVHLKPGKPIWFGVLDSDDSPRRYVFGLPGNPVSSLVCFELFVRTAIRRLMGIDPAMPQAVRAKLGQEHIVHSDRPTYHPARLDRREAEAIVTPVPWHGSSDLRATVDANGMILFPPGERAYDCGEAVDVFVWG